MFRIRCQSKFPLLAAIASCLIDVFAARAQTVPPPSDISVKDMTSQSGEAVRLRWTFPIEQTSAITGFKVLRKSAGTGAFENVAEVSPVTRKFVDSDVKADVQYQYQLVSTASGGAMSSTIESATVTPHPSALARFQRFTSKIVDWKRAWLFVVVVVISGAVVAFIFQARRGKPLKIRKIAGLEAVDEAVGRATEMGRSVLFIPGIQDMNDIQTVAGITILARVARTAAEYDARVEVPTCRSLVMTAARETVQSSFLGAGRPDAYNQDLIYYVTDEQFGYVAYLSGMMVREKPAACFYMGSFFAESLILAETGNSIGAIQIAGTAQPAQLPFFVAACDYTLIGEEFFAASAYLSGEPEQLGSLKGQDVGKMIVAVGMIIGCIIATIAEFSPGAFGLLDALDFLRETMLT